MASTIDLPDLRTRLRLDATGFETGKRKVQRGLGDLSGGFRGARLTATAGAIGIAGAVLSMATDVDLGLRKVNSLFGVTGDAAEKSFEGMRKQLRELSDEIGVAQDTLVEGLYQAISAGVPRENAFSFLRVAAKAAIAGVTDTNTAVEGLSKVINAFGLSFADVDEVADSMFTTVNKGIVTFEELSARIFQSAPAAAAAGVSYKEMNAALTALTSGSIPMAEAATRIQAVLSAVARNGKELNPIFRELGFASAEAAIRQKGLKFALDAIYKASGGTQAALIGYLGRVEAAQAVNVLAGQGADKFTASIKEQNEATNAANIAFEEIEKSGARRFERSMVRIKNQAIDVGAAVLPIAAQILEAIADIAGAAGDLPGPVKVAGAAIIGIAVAGKPIAGIFKAANSAVAAAVRTMQQIQVVGGMERLRDGANTASKFGNTMTGISVKAGSARSSLVNLIRSGLTPTNVVLGAALVAIGAWIRLKARARAEIDALTDALKREREGISGSTDEVLIKQIEDRKLLEGYLKRGIAIDRVIAAIKGEKGAQEEVNRALDEADEAYLRDIAAKQGVDLATAKVIARHDAFLLQTRGLKSETEDLGNVFKDSSDKETRLALATDQAAAAQGAATGKAKGHASALADTATEASAASDALSRFREQLDKTLGLHLDLESAQIAVRESLAEVREAFKENGKSLDIITKKGRENRRAVLDHIRDIKDEAVIWAERNGKGEDAAAIDDRIRKGLDRLADRFPSLRDEVKGFAKDLADVKDKTVTMHVRAPKFKYDIKNLKEFGATTIIPTSVGFQEFHSGGRVPGPSGRERLIVAQGGENVQTEEQKAATDAAMATLVALASRPPVPNVFNASISISGVSDPRRAVELAAQRFREIADEQIGAEEDHRADIARMVRP
jgi:TP901 family phage tail tape measure protein